MMKIHRYKDMIVFEEKLSRFSVLSAQTVFKNNTSGNSFRFNINTNNYWFFCLKKEHLIAFSVRFEAICITQENRTKKIAYFAVIFVEINVEDKLSQQHVLLSK